VINNLAYIHVSKSKRSKLETKYIKCMTLGYNDQSKAYRCFDPKENKVLINKYVVLDERIIGLFTLLWKQAFKFDNTAKRHKAKIPKENSTRSTRKNE
jgi:hypothetical protein